VRSLRALGGLIILAGACSDRPLYLPSLVEASDLAALDLARSDLAASDLAVSDLAASDLARRDLAAPDLAHVDASDLAQPDLLPACKSVVVTTLAGNGNGGYFDGTGGPNGTTEFYYPYGVALDAAGTLYISDALGGRIRKVAPDGTTTTLTGNGGLGFWDGTGGPNGTTVFYMPRGLAVDSAGNVYVADSGNSCIRKVAPDGTTTTLAGNGRNGFADGTGGRNGTAVLWYPYDVALDGADNVLVADPNGNRIRKVAPDGTTTTLAGNGNIGYVDGTGGPNGSTEFHGPGSVSLDASGNLFIGDSQNERIRKVAKDGTTSTFAGNGVAGFAEGTGGANGTAQFQYPQGTAFDASGNLYVADTWNNAVRKVAPDGTVTTIAGGPNSGFVDGDGCAARFSDPSMIAVSGKLLFVTDMLNNRVRKLQLP
jgi:NHL repeat